MLLLIALAAIIIATVCLYMDTKDYPASPPYKDAPPVSLQWERCPDAAAGPLVAGARRGDRCRAIRLQLAALGKRSWADSGSLKADS
mgnify:CR=1 FL=1